MSPEQPSRTLVAGWFSFDGMGATAGDLLARDVACGWLEGAGEAYDIAHGRAFPGGVDWRSVDPDSYSQLLFVCGPFYVGRKLMRYMPRRVASRLITLGSILSRPRLNPISYIPLELLVRRFPHARFIGLDVSVMGSLEGWQPFDILLERDSAAVARPDLSFASERPSVPLVGIVFVEQSRQHCARTREAAERALRALAESREVARVMIDTRLDPPNRGGLRTAAEVESLIAAMDVVLTTRLHGLVLALKNGVPAIALDPFAGGGKVIQQAQVIGWPMAFTPDGVTEQELNAAVDFCLSAEGRAKAVECSDRAVSMLSTVHQQLLASITKTP